MNSMTHKLVKETPLCSSLVPPTNPNFRSSIVCLKITRPSESLRKGIQGIESKEYFSAIIWACSETPVLCLKQTKRIRANSCYWNQSGWRAVDLTACPHRRLSFNGMKMTDIFFVSDRRNYASLLVIHFRQRKWVVIKVDREELRIKR